MKMVEEHQSQKAKGGLEEDSTSSGFSVLSESSLEQVNMNTNFPLLSERNTCSCRTNSTSEDKLSDTSESCVRRLSRCKLMFRERKLNDSILLRKKRHVSSPSAPADIWPVMKCGCVRSGSPLLRVRGHITRVDPPLSSSSLDLVSGTCPSCHTRSKYSTIEDLQPLKVKQLCSPCSKKSGKSVYLNLELYAKLIITDTKKEYEAAVGEKLRTKLYWCSALEYICNTQTRDKVWKRLKRFVSKKHYLYYFYLEQKQEGDVEIVDIKLTHL